MSKDQWASLSLLPPDGIFDLAARARAAKGSKANLVIGAYRDKDGKPYPLHCVRKAERRLLDMNLDHEYLPISGHPGFVAAATRMLYADSVSPADVVGCQTLSGTGAVSIGALFLSHIMDRAKCPVYISDPTWPNHYAVFSQAGWKSLHTYRYWNAQTRGLDFEGMKEDILNAPAGSVFVLHQCAHNPTGVDPTHAQWDELADLFVKTQHQVFFDSAYQGYASGNLDNDAYAIRAFVKKGLQVIAAQSFAKNMGLYGERVGCLSVVVTKDAKTRGPIVKSHLESITRAAYSNPPAYGARIAHLILTDKALRVEWEAELASMSARIRAMRELVYNELKRLNTPGTWDHVVNQIGMFSFLGLTKEQCQFCQDHNVFITLTGRANMAGLTEKTALLLARTIDRAVRDVHGAKL